MGRIADRWNSMSDEQKLAELREPTITRSWERIEMPGRKARQSKVKRDQGFHASFEALVVRVRRKAMALDRLVERAELVDKTWAKLKRDFRRAEIAADFVEAMRRAFYSETVHWHWFGHREDYPPGEGE
jgi:hypothetical protein